MPKSTRSLQTLVRAASPHHRRHTSSIQSSSHFQFVRSQQITTRRVIFCPKRDSCSRGYSISETILAGWSNNNNFGAIRNNSTLGTNKNNGDINNITNIHSNNGEMMNTYAVALITSNKDGNTKLSTKNLSIQQIVREIPGTHARDFFSLSLTSLGDASRKRRAMMNHYSVNNNIHPWFILPRESEIVVSGNGILPWFVHARGASLKNFVKAHYVYCLLL